MRVMKSVEKIPQKGKIKINMSVPEMITLKLELDEALKHNPDHYMVKELRDHLQAHINSDNAYNR